MAPESVCVEQILDLRTWLTYDEQAIRRDIPDAVAFMLACGMRIGEVAAVHWRHVDLADGTVEVAGNVVRVKGKGLIIQEDDSSKLTAARYLPGTVLDDQPVFPAPSYFGRRRKTGARTVLEALDLAAGSSGLDLN